MLLWGVQGFCVYLHCTSAAVVKGARWCMATVTVAVGAGFARACISVPCILPLGSTVLSSTVLTLVSAAPPAGSCLLVKDPHPWMVQSCSECGHVSGVFLLSPVRWQQQLNQTLAK